MREERCLCQCLDTMGAAAWQAAGLPGGQSCLAGRPADPDRAQTAPPPRGGASAGAPERSCAGASSLERRLPANISPKRLAFMPSEDSISKARCLNADITDARPCTRRGAQQALSQHLRATWQRLRGRRRGGRGRSRLPDQGLWPAAGFVLSKAAEQARGLAALACAQQQFAVSILLCHRYAKRSAVDIMRLAQHSDMFLQRSSTVYQARHQSQSRLPSVSCSAFGMPRAALCTQCACSALSHGPAACKHCPVSSAVMAVAPALLTLRLT